MATLLSKTFDVAALDTTTVLLLSETIKALTLPELEVVPVKKTLPFRCLIATVPCPVIVSLNTGVGGCASQENITFSMSHYYSSLSGYCQP